MTEKVARIMGRVESKLSLFCE